MANVKLFIDFWNFQLSWNHHIRPDQGSAEKFVRINWLQLPQIIISELPTVLGPSADMAYKGTQLYASVNPTPGSADAGLKKFLHNILGQMTGYDVNVRSYARKLVTL